MTGQNQPNQAPFHAAAEFKSLLSTRSVAFLGASRDERKWGGIVLKHLFDGGFKGKIFPLNPREEEIMGLKVYRQVRDILEVLDLAIIVVPPAIAVNMVRECVGKGINLRFTSTPFLLVY